MTVPITHGNSWAKGQIGAAAEAYAQPQQNWIPAACQPTPQLEATLDP